MHWYDVLLHNEPCFLHGKLCVYNNFLKMYQLITQCGKMYILHWSSILQTVALLQNAVSVWLHFGLLLHHCYYTIRLTPFPRLESFVKIITCFMILAFRLRILQKEISPVGTRFLVNNAFQGRLFDSGQGPNTFWQMIRNVASPVSCQSYWNGWVTKAL